VEAPLPPMPPKASLMAQLSTLVARSSVLVVKDPTLLFGRVAAMALTELVLALLYTQTREYVQEQVAMRLNYAIIFVACTCFNSLIVVIRMASEVGPIRSEMRSGMYTAAPFVSSTLCLQVPLMLVAAAVGMLLPAFLIGNWPWVSFGPLLLIVAAMILYFDALAEMLSILITNVATSIVVVSMVIMMHVFFAGFFVQPSLVPMPLVLLIYINPVYHCSAAFAYAIFIHTPPYDGVLPCTADDAATQPMCATRSFYCPGVTVGTGCLGRTGDEILTSLHQIYEIVENEDCVARALCITVSFRAAMTHRCHAPCTAPPASLRVLLAHALQRGPHAPRWRTALCVARAVRLVCALQAGHLLDSPPQNDRLQRAHNLDRARPEGRISAPRQGHEIVRHLWRND
jgi:hypothetical protein